MTDLAANRLYGILFGSLGIQKAHSVMLVELSDHESTTRIAGGLSQAIASHGNRVLLVGINDIDNAKRRSFGAMEVGGAVEPGCIYPTGLTKTSFEDVDYVGFDMSKYSIDELSNYLLATVDAGVSVVAVAPLDSAALVSSVCEATVMMITHGETSRSLSKQVVQDLEVANANVVGVVSAKLR
tara:strand:- start:9971 stop:10519 length:549 start_codon:yes stop_codon:yes gene_type:complete